MAADKRPAGNDLARAIRKAGPYLNIGYVLIASILIFGLLGHWVDGRTGQEPLFLIIGLFSGLALGFYNMVKVIREMERK